MKPEECLSVKVNHLDLLFLTLHISYESSDTLSSISLAKGLFFKLGFPPCGSYFESKNK